MAKSCRNHKRRERPDPGCCGPKPAPRVWKLGPITITIPRWHRPHDWRYSWSWNGNDKRVLPWWPGTSGIGRSGWRCYHCGEMRWDQSDLEYAATMANSLPGKIDVAALIGEAMTKEAEYHD